MAIPKKGSRKIVVDGIEYRWRIRWKPSYGQGIGESNLTAVVELYENPQSTLVITFPWLRLDALVGVAEETVMPKMIKNCIKNALAQGWNPNKKGKTFKLNQEKE